MLKIYRKCPKNRASGIPVQCPGSAFPCEGRGRQEDYPRNTRARRPGLGRAERGQHRFFYTIRSFLCGICPRSFAILRCENLISIATTSQCLQSLVGRSRKAVDSVTRKRPNQLKKKPTRKTPQYARKTFKRILHSFAELTENYLVFVVHARPSSNVSRCKANRALLLYHSLATHSSGRWPTAGSGCKSAPAPR